MSDEILVAHIRAEIQAFINKIAQEVLEDAQKELAERIRHRVGQFAVDAATHFNVTSRGTEITIKLRDQTDRSDP